MMKYCIELIACLIVNEEENVSKAKRFDEAKDREPSRTKNKYSTETIRSGIVIWRNCYLAELLPTRVESSELE